MKFKGTSWKTPFEQMLKTEEVIRAQETPKTFKEQLKNKADDFEKQTDVSEHIEIVKKKMEKVATLRKFQVYLIEPTGISTLAFGSNESSYTTSYTIFIPKKILAWKYVQIFKDALKELGFEYDDIVTSVSAYNDYNCWILTLNW